PTRASVTGSICVTRPISHVPAVPKPTTFRHNTASLPPRDRPVPPSAPLLDAGPQRRHLVLPAAGVALPLVLAHRIGQVKGCETALHHGHADLLAGRPDVELHEGGPARRGRGAAERARPAVRDVALGLDADYVDDVGALVVPVRHGRPSRTGRWLGLAAGQPPAGPCDKLPDGVHGGPDGDPLFDPVFHG